jgi:hypothetical protein
MASPISLRLKASLTEMGFGLGDAFIATKNTDFLGRVP